MDEVFFSRDSAGNLCIGEQPLQAIAERLGTPCYVYSQAAIEAASTQWQAAFAGSDHQLCYSVKANSNLRLLRLLADSGWHFDIVSAGELERLIGIGVPGERVRFSGVGKTPAELDLAVHSGIGAVHLESAAEARILNDIAARHRRPVAVAVRINPDITAGGQIEISTAKASDKFGVPLAEAAELYAYLAAASHLNPTAMAFHLGSQIDSPAPYIQAINKVLPVLQQLRAQGIAIGEIDIGGGLAVNESGEDSSSGSKGLTALPPAELAAAILPTLASNGLKPVLSPGRSVVAGAGVLLTQTLYCKNMGGRRIVIVDAAMNDYIRPALYGVRLRVRPLQLADTTADLPLCDISGPVCESTDCFVHQVAVPFTQGALLALMDTGAYGMSMSSNYNSRPRPPEAWVRADGWQVVRRRENMDDLLAPEREINDD